MRKVITQSTFFLLLTRNVQIGLLMWSQERLSARVGQKYVNTKEDVASRCESNTHHNYLITARARALL